MENKSNVGDIENAIQTNKIQSRDTKKEIQCEQIINELQKGGSTGDTISLIGFHYVGRGRTLYRNPGVARARPYRPDVGPLSHSVPPWAAHCPSHLAPGLVRILVPLLLSVNSRCPQRLLCEGLVTPIALVSAL